MVEAEAEAVGVATVAAIGGGGGGGAGIVEDKREFNTFKWTMNSRRVTARFWFFIV